MMSGIHIIDLDMIPNLLKVLNKCQGELKLTLRSLKDLLTDYQLYEIS